VVLRAVGQRVTLTVDGKVVSDGERDIPDDGRFAWGVGGPDGEVRVRNVRLTDLSKPADPPK
jgi:hypothetical protein